MCAALLGLMFVCSTTTLPAAGAVAGSGPSSVRTAAVRSIRTLT